MKKFLNLLFLLAIIATSCDSNSSDIEPLDKSQNLLATGASANDILSNVNFDRLLIQVAYDRGFRPTPETMTNFTNYLREHTFKKNIAIDYLELNSPNEETLTLEEIDELEKKNRTAYNNGTTLAIYIYFADAPSDGDDLDEGLVTLGAVFRNTSMVIFERTIRTLSGQSLAITTTDVETATLNHEFGHLFGLVNLGTTPINEHEDTAAPNHCNVEGCLMRAELIFGIPTAKALVSSAKTELVSACSLSGNTVLKMLESQAAKGANIVPRLDNECLLDLRNNGGR